MAIKRKSKQKARGPNLKASRRAAGINVAISIAAATALLIVVNVISSKKNYRRDVETLGWYGLTDAAEKILDQMDQPIRLTSIYTSTKPDKKPQEYLPRLRDLMDEVARRKDNVVVVNVTSDRQKAEVLARLRGRLDEAAADHSKVIRDFQILADTQSRQYEQMVRQWQAYPLTGWLVQFGIPKAVEAVMTTGGDELRKTARELREELEAGSLPDYPGMVGQVADTLNRLAERLEGISEGLRSLSSLPEKAEKARPELTKAAEAVNNAIAKVSEQVGKAGSPVPADPSKVLDEFISASRAVAVAAEAAARRLDRFAEGGYAGYARSWRMGTVPLPAQYHQLATAAANLAAHAQNSRQREKVEIQKKSITQLRQIMPEFLAQAGKIQAAVDKLLNELAKLDDPTREVFKQAGQEQYLQGQIKPLKNLAKRANDLVKQAGEADPLTEWKEAIEQINQDNIVLVEIGEKIGVVGFDDVWPLAAWGETGSDEETPKRNFYGDMAICTKMLCLTDEPFADVVLTFFEDIPEQIPPQWRGQQQAPVVGPIYSGELRTVRERLEKANLEVVEWNIAKQDTPPAPKEKGRPQVLLILPPPEPLPPLRGHITKRPPQWNPDHTDKVRNVIAGGTPAVFLARYFYPRYVRGLLMPGYYGFAEYLRNDWGIDVKTALRVIQTSPDSLNPGKFKLPIQGWKYMALSTFTDHPVGKPLKARRLYWLNACPVTRVSESKSGAKIEDILIVPKHREEMWAVSDIEGFGRKVMQRRPLEPDSKSGDILPPFAVAVEADKEIKGKQTRIIVLAVGDSLTDEYLQEPITLLREDRTIAQEPPPTGNVDVLVNSVYYLIDKSEYAGAGPTIVEPVEITPKAMTAVKILFGAVWPALMFAAGIVVMLVRRR